MNTQCKSLLLIVISVMGGCSPAPRSLPYDSQQAEEILVAALDAWKQGRVGDLAKRSPPVRFEDEDCRNGLRLVEYRVESRELPLRPFDDVEVTLQLRNRQGTAIERSVTYQVGLTPNPAVLRSD